MMNFDGSRYEAEFRFETGGGCNALQKVPSGQAINP